MLYFYIDLGTNNSFIIFVDVSKINFIFIDSRLLFTNYIKVMCKIWGEKAHNTHLEHLIKLVKRDTFVAGDLTVDRDTHNFGFNSLLFFNPGITRPY